MNGLSFEALGVLTFAQANPTLPMTVSLLMERGCKERQARRILRELVDAGLIEAEQFKGRDGRFTEAVYGLVAAVGTDTNVGAVASVGTVENDRTDKNAATVSNARVPVGAHETESSQQEPEKKKTNTARVHETPPARYVQSRAKAHSRVSQSPARKPYDDIEHGVRFGLINAWCSNLRAQPIGAFKKDANHETAADLARAGYTEADVERFVQAKRKDSWWDGKTLTLQKVAELLPEWLAANRPKPRFVTDDAFLSEEELNAYRPTGTEYLVTYAQ